MTLTFNELFDIIQEATGLGSSDFQNNFELVKCRITSGILQEFCRRKNVKEPDMFRFVEKNNINSMERLRQVLNDMLPGDTTVCYTPVHSPNPGQNFPDLINTNLSNLANQISNDQKEVTRIVNNINDSSTIKIERHWYGTLDRDSIEDGFNTVYRDFGSVLKNYGLAVNKTNGNLIHILELIKLLAVIEKGLFEQIDEQTTSINEFKEMFIQYCKEKGIDDDAVHELIECSFQRSYTLRERITTLRQDYQKSISQCQQRLSQFEQKHNSLDSSINKIIDTTKRELDATLTADKTKANNSYKEILSKITQFTQSSSKEITSKIESFNKKVEEKDKQIKDFVSKANSILVDVKKIKDDLIQYCTKEENAINSITGDAKKQIEKNKEEKSKELNDTASKYISDCKTQLKVISDGYNLDISKLYESIKKNCKEVEENIKSKQENAQKECEQATKDINELVKKHKSDIDKMSKALMEDFAKRLTNQQQEFEEQKEKLQSSFKNKIIWTYLGAVATSGAISYLVLTLF